MYCDQIGLFEQLPDAQAGKLIKLIFDYVNDKNPVVKDLLLKVAFEPIKLQLKRDLMTWSNIVKRNQINGAKGGRPKKPKEPSGFSGNPKKPKEADTDNDNDTKNLNGEFTNSPATFDEKYMAFIDLFNDIKGRVTGRKGKFRGESKSKAQFKVLLKTYIGKEITKGILSMFRDQHHIDTGYKYATPELLTRAEKFHRFYENA